MLPIDYNRVFENIDNITQLPLERRGKHWVGACYINGRPHVREDKTVVSKKNGVVMILEQGGESMSIAHWLVTYGGLNKHTNSKDNYKDAYLALKQCRPAQKIHYDYTMGAVISNYVSPENMYDTSSNNHSENNLFIYLCSIFGKEKALNAFNTYMVKTDRHNNTVFWYTDRNKNICHDKRMKYLKNGKRDKMFGGSRYFSVRKGYNKRCYFGEHLLSEKGQVRLVESEKTALIGYITCGGIWLATGGANNINKVGDDWYIYADYDKAGFAWEQKYTCYKWYQENGKLLDVELGDDVGDLIIKRITKNNPTSI